MDQIVNKSFKYVTDQSSIIFIGIQKCPAAKGTVDNAWHQKLPSLQKIRKRKSIFRRKSLIRIELALGIKGIKSYVQKDGTGKDVKKVDCSCC